MVGNRKGKKRAISSSGDDHVRSTESATPKRLKTGTQATTPASKTANKSHTAATSSAKTTPVKQPEPASQESPIVKVVAQYPGYQSIIGQKADKDAAAVTRGQQSSIARQQDGNRQVILISDEDDETDPIDGSDDDNLEALEKIQEGSLSQTVVGELDTELHTMADGTYYLIHPTRGMGLRITRNQSENRMRRLQDHSAFQRSLHQLRDTAVQQAFGSELTDAELRALDLNSSRVFFPSLITKNLDIRTQAIREHKTGANSQYGEYKTGVFASDCDLELKSFEKHLAFLRTIRSAVDRSEKRITNEIEKTKVKKDKNKGELFKVEGVHDDMRAIYHEAAKDTSRQERYQLVEGMHGYLTGLTELFRGGLSAQQVFSTRMLNVIEEKIGRWMDLVTAVHLQMGEWGHWEREPWMVETMAPGYHLCRCDECIIQPGRILDISLYRQLKRQAEAVMVDEEYEEEIPNQATAEGAQASGSELTEVTAEEDQATAKGKVAAKSPFDPDTRAAPFDVERFMMELRATRNDEAVQIERRVLSILAADMRLLQDMEDMDPQQRTDRKNMDGEPMGDELVFKPEFVEQQIKIKDLHLEDQKQPQGLEDISLRILNQRLQRRLWTAALGTFDQTLRAEMANSLWKAAVSLVDADGPYPDRRAAFRHLIGFYGVGREDEPLIYTESPGPDFVMEEPIITVTVKQNPKSYEKAYREVSAHFPRPEGFEGRCPEYYAESYNDRPPHERAARMHIVDIDGDYLHCNTLIPAPDDYSVAGKSVQPDGDPRLYWVSCTDDPKSGSTAKRDARMAAARKWYRWYMVEQFKLEEAEEALGPWKPTAQTTAGAELQTAEHDWYQRQNKEKLMSEEESVYRRMHMWTEEHYTIKGEYVMLANYSEPRFDAEWNLLDRTGELMKPLEEADEYFHSKIGDPTHDPKITQQYIMDWVNLRVAAAEAGHYHFTREAIDLGLKLKVLNATLNALCGDPEAEVFKMANVVGCDLELQIQRTRDDIQECLQRQDEIEVSKAEVDEEIDYMQKLQRKVQERYGITTKDNTAAGE